MDDIGNIIYVIIILVSLVASFWQKANKDKTARREAQEMREEEAQAAPVPTRRAVQRDFKPMDSETLSDQEKASAALLREMEAKAKLAAAGRGKRRTQIMDARTDKAEKLQKNKLAEDLKDFDLKKAIIYNEILNRPYQ